MTDVRTAGPDDRAAAVELLDAAMLEVDRDRIGDRIGSGDVLLAESDGRVVGVCVLEPGGEGEGGRAATEITQIAVHRSRRARGVGRALVEAAAARTDGPLTATFREQVRPFYEAVGFEITDREEEGGSRFRGVLR